MLNQQQQQWLAQQQELEYQRSERQRGNQSASKQPSATVDMRVQPSPTPSSTSSLSLYSGDSITKKAQLAELEEELEELKQAQAGEKDKSGAATFCSCLNFKSLFGGGKSKARKDKEERILGPPRRHSQMSQTSVASNSSTNRRRPSPLNL